MVQWLGLGAFTAMDLGLIPGQGTKIHKPRGMAKYIYIIYIILYIKYNIYDYIYYIMYIKFIIIYI